MKNENHSKEQLRHQRRRPMRIFVGVILCIAAVGSAWTISQYRARKATEAANADNPVYGRPRTQLHWQTSSSQMPV